MSFDSFGLRPEILRAVRELGYQEPTPIQEQAIPRVLGGEDLLGCAQTGTGKTAAFALPIIQRLHGTAQKGRGRRAVRALVLAPTRELAAQIGRSFADYARHTGLASTVVFGGVSQNPQAQALRQGIDILVATPGRLLDLMSQGLLSLRAVEVLVLDEADRMLDMGFIRDIRRIIETLPQARQTLLFSATLPPAIEGFAGEIMNRPARVAADPTATPVEAIDHRVHFVEKSHKVDLLRHLLADPSVKNALVFTRTRRGAERLTRHLSGAAFRAEAIHGDKTQSARERALSNFKGGKTRVLVATDVAARGLDIVDLSHVVNFDIPEEPENYVHRSGRTGRAGASGVALSLCAVEERSSLAAIERLIRKRLTVMEDHPFRSEFVAPKSPVGSGIKPPPGTPRPYMIRAEELIRPRNGRGIPAGR